MKKKELINRWKTDEGTILLASVIDTLVRNRPLASVPGLGKYADRWDLRGAVLSKVIKTQKIEADGHGFVRNLGNLYMKNARIESVDFSYSDISFSFWRRCEIKNCIWEEVRAKESRFTDCDIEGCIFQRTDLSYSWLNKNIGANSGSYRNVYFNQCNLSEAIFAFPIIQNCTFEQCNLQITDFNGSRFVDCTFKGTVDSAWFRGYAWSFDKNLVEILFKTLDPRKYPNLMQNVDFSEATLKGVSFTHGIDLSNCKLPNGNEYILLRNMSKTMQEARKIIDTQWYGEDKRIGLYMIDEVYFREEKQNLKIGFIDTFPFPTSEARFDEKFFGLIRKLNV